MLHIKRLTAALLALLLPLSGWTQSGEFSMESDWLEFVTGHRDESSGAEMREIDADSSPDYNQITLAIPKNRMKHPDSIEEVVVVGRKPEKPEPILDVSYEWLDDYDEDNYGLVIRLGKDTKWPIRLYMRSNEGYIRQ